MTARREVTRIPKDPPASERIARALQCVALAVFLGALVSRCFLLELPFASSGALRVGQRAASSDVLGASTADRSEISRITFAMVVLGCCALWGLGRAIRGKLAVRCLPLVVLIAIFAAWSLVSVSGASHQRAAINAWIEQVAVMMGGFLAIQMFATRYRFALLLVVLAGVGGALAVKGVWQLSVEIPDRVANFEVYRDQWLERFGWADETPQAGLIESRLRDNSLTGFFGLANLFGSLLILLAGAGAALAIEKFAAGRKGLKTSDAPRAPGEIHLPSLAGILTAIVAGATVWIMILTRSRAVIAGSAICAGGGVLVYLLRGWVGRHWGKCVAGLGVLVLLVAGGLIGYGVRNDRLPSKSMTFRWYYWTAGEEIVRERPVFGVGPGNFAAGYLKHRRPAGEEEIKLPHNIIVHAAAQYGLPGAGIYLLILACFLIGAIRPRRALVGNDGSEGGSAAHPAISARATLSILLIVVVSVLVSRYLVASPAGDFSGAVLLFEVILPGAVVGMFLVVAAWWGQGFAASSSRLSSAARVALGTALCAFVLHNMVTFSLSVPGTALVFWVLCGACVGQSAGKGREFKIGRWVLPVAMSVVVIAVYVLIWRPVLTKTLWTERMLAEDSPSRAADLAELAAQADPLDPASAADAARVHLLRYRAEGELASLDIAYQWSLEAIRRDGEGWGYHRLAALIAEQIERVGEQDDRRAILALSHMGRAVRLDPSDARLRIDYAEMLLLARRYEQALEELAKAQEIDAELFPESVRKLNADERIRIEHIRNRCSFRQLIGPDDDE